MPDDNRFAGLSEAVEEDDPDLDPDPDPDEESDDGATADAGSSDESATEPESAVSDVDTDPEAESGGADSEAESASEADDAGADVDAESDSNDTSGSSDSSAADDPTAFPFDATKKKTVYVRPETLDEMEDARALVDAQLRTDHDVRDLTGREFYDAAFRLAAADTDGLIDEILEARAE